MTRKFASGWTAAMPTPTTGGFAVEADLLQRDRGFPARYFWAGLVVGLTLLAAGAYLALSDATSRIYPLTMCIGFGLLLAAFGTRAVVRGGRAESAGVVAGAGAVAVALYAVFVWLTPDPTAALKIRKIDLSGDLEHVTGLRLIDDAPLYSTRTDDARSYKFIVLDPHLASPVLRLLVETSERGEGREIFEMRAQREQVQRLLDESPNQSWRLNYAAQTVTDHQRRIVFRSVDELDELLLQGPSDPPRAWNFALIRSALAGDMPADPASIARLIADLQADDAAVRRLARERLAAIGPSAVPALMRALAEAPDAYRLRLGVAYALNAMLRSRPEVVAEVARQLTDADIDRLAAAVGDPDKTVRLYVTEFLYQLGDPRSVAAALRIVEGRDARVAPAEQSNAAYNSLLVIKAASGQLATETKDEIAASIDQAVPAEARRSRSLAEQIIRETGERSP